MKIKPKQLTNLKVKGRNITIRKINELYYAEGGHPNGIDVGYMAKGIAGDLVVGERFHIQGAHIRDDLTTSTVLEIVDHNCFKTKNSMYEIIIND